MSGAIESWLTPLLFISAPALMILSTAARYAQLHSEIHFLHEHGHDGGNSELEAAALHGRAKLFRNALAALYSAICLFATASLLGAVITLWWDHALLWVSVLTVLGIAAVIFAAGSLGREAMLSLRIIDLHFAEHGKD